MSPTPAVEVHGLTKTFGRVTALDGLELTVPTGQVAGFLGPNGAGKSTTIRILLGCCGLTRARSGCSAPTRGRTRWPCTAGSRTCRGTWSSGRT